ncbi:MAG: ECF-type sigma factor [Pseudomonadota bacterium]
MSEENADLGAETAAFGAADPALSEQTYRELRLLARAQLRRQLKTGGTLNTTALVHEAYLKLGEGQHSWASPTHFYATMAKVMRHILIDAARRRARPKHGAGRPPVAMQELKVELTDASSEIVDLLAIDAALRELGKLEPRLERVAEMRFFGGLEVADVAEVLGVSTPTVKRDTAAARAFIAAELK